MRLTRLLIHGYLRIPYGFRRITRTGSFGRRGGVFVEDTAPAGNALKRALWANYVRQYHESSCSVASVVTVVNALRRMTGSGPAPITQHEILDTVRTGHWKARMSDSGYHGRRGLLLPLLGEVVRAALDAYHIAYAGVDTVRADADTVAASGIKKTLLERLQAFDASGGSILIAHFDQGAYVPAYNIPHISPVGGFDSDTGQVTVLDVDPDQPGPYRVSFDTFYAGLASNYHHVFRRFGYDGGGYVHIRIS